MSNSSIGIGSSFSIYFIRLDYDNVLMNIKRRLLFYPGRQHQAADCKITHFKLSQCDHLRKFSFRRPVKREQVDSMQCTLNAHAFGEKKWFDFIWFPWITRSLIGYQISIKENFRSGNLFMFLSWAIKCTISLIIVVKLVTKEVFKTWYRVPSQKWISK